MTLDTLRPSVTQVVDHCDNQKESYKRLFDAEVIVQSYKQELEESKATVTDLQLDRLGNFADAAHREAAGAHSAMHAKALKGGEEDTDFGDDRDVGNYIKRPIPNWLRNDQASRKMIEQFRASMRHEYDEEGFLNNTTVTEHGWQVEWAARRD